MTLTSRLLSAVNGSRGDGLPIRVPSLGRRDLPGLVRDLGYTSGAEIGVWKGAYSASFFPNDRLHLLCVDPWMSYPAWRDTKNALEPAQQDALMAEAYREAHVRLAPLNCSLIRKFSSDAAKDVKDRSIDFVYIDGNHVYEAVLEDLAAWAPKVKPGGFIAGHDFRVSDRKPFIQVVRAVTEWTTQQAIDPWFALCAESTPSFLWEVR